MTSADLRPRLHRWAARTLMGAALLAVSPSLSHAQAIVAIVNGAPISTMDVQNRSALLKLGGENADRKTIVEMLIEERLKLLEARRVGLSPSDPEVDQMFAGIGQNMKMSPVQLTAALKSRGVNAESLKTRLRADIGWSRFVREKFRATSAVREQDVIAALSDTEKKKTEEVQAASYTINPVILVLPKDASDARVAQRRTEAISLRTRFRTCEEGLALAKGLRDVAVRPVVTRSSTGMNENLQKMLASTPIGTLTPPERGDEGIEMFAICGKKEESGSLALQAKMREQLTNEGMQVQARRYLNDLKARAIIEYR